MGCGGLLSKEFCTYFSVGGVIWRIAAKGTVFLDYQRTVEVLISGIVFCSLTDEMSNCCFSSNSSGIKVAWEVTGKCNLECLHCCANSNLQREDAGPETINAVLRFLLCLEVNKLIITGGEPLILPGIFDLLKELKHRGYNLSLCTNGTLINEAAVTTLSALDLSNITIGLDGYYPNTHDYFRGLDGAHMKATRAITALVAAGCNVTVHITLTDINSRELGLLLDYLSDLGVNISLGTVYQVGRANPVNDVCSLIKREQVEALLEGCPPVENKGWNDSPCEAGHKILGILPEGLLVPCLLLREQYRGLSLLDNVSAERLLGLLLDDVTEQGILVDSCSTPISLIFKDR